MVIFLKSVSVFVLLYIFGTSLIFDLLFYTPSGFATTRWVHDFSNSCWICPHNKLSTPKQILYQNQTTVLKYKIKNYNHIKYFHNFINNRYLRRTCNNIRKNMVSIRKKNRSYYFHVLRNGRENFFNILIINRTKGYGTNWMPHFAESTIHRLCKYKSSCKQEFLFYLYSDDWDSKHVSPPPLRCDLHHPKRRVKRYLLDKRELSLAPPSSKSFFTY